MSETKTRGDVLRECVRRVVGNRDAREVFTNDGERAAAFDAIAAEYDTARAQLPEDVEAVVVACERHAAQTNGSDCKTWNDIYTIVDNYESSTKKLAAIIRGQRGRILDLEADNRAVYAERDALTDRLEKLETCIVCGCGLLPSNDPPHCEDSCIVSDEQRSEWDEIRAKWSVR